MSTTVSVYIAEASPARLRGRLVAFQSVLITMGRFCGALASAVAFSLNPPVTGRKQPVLMMTTDLLTATKAHQPLFRLHWLDVLNFSSRRSVKLTNRSSRLFAFFFFTLFSFSLVRFIHVLFSSFNVFRRRPHTVRQLFISRERTRERVRITKTTRPAQQHRPIVLFLFYIFFPTRNLPDSELNSLSLFLYIPISLPLSLTMCACY